MGEFREIIVAALNILRPDRIVEVGSEHGGSTRILLDYVISHKAHLTVIDPKPSSDFFELLRRSPSESVTYLNETSVNALPKTPSANIYFLDGDHNYWTVFRELESIFSTCKKIPWIFLHDVGFPCADRDLYYAPETIPREALHEHTFDDGVDSENKLVIRGGFRGNGNYAIAKHRGGPKNGVRKAVEDFVAGRSDLSFQSIAPIFGLGVLTPATEAQIASNLLSPYRSELIEKMEKNRMELYIKVIELQDRINMSPMRRFAARLRGRRTAP